MMKVTQVFKVVPDAEEYEAYGITIDGEHQALPDQPPVAKSNGWGKMGWARRR